MPKFVTVQQVAGIAGVSDQTIRTWIDDGKLRARPLSPKVIRIYIDSAAEFLGLSVEEIEEALKVRA